MTAQAQTHGGAGSVLGLAALACVAGIVALLNAASVVTETLDAQPLPQQTLIMPPPVAEMVVNWGGPSISLWTETEHLTVILQEATAMEIPIGAMRTSGHPVTKHSQYEVDRVHKRLQELPAAYIAKHKDPCWDNIVRIPVPMENGEWGLEVLIPVGPGLYQEKTAFIAARGWQYINEVLNDCHHPGGMAGAQ